MLSEVKAIFSILVSNLVYTYIDISIAINYYKWSEKEILVLPSIGDKRLPTTE